MRFKHNVKRRYFLLLAGVIILVAMSGLRIDALASQPANDGPGLVFVANECYYKSAGSKEIIVRGSLRNLSRTQYVYAVKPVKITVCDGKGQLVAVGELKARDMKVKRIMPGGSCPVLVSLRAGSARAKLATFPDKPKVKASFTGYSKAPVRSKGENISG